MVTFTTAGLLAMATAWLLPFLRVAALFSSAPVLSHRALPVRVRLAAAGVIAACVALSAPAPPPLDGNALLVAAVEQLAVGLAIGFALQLVFAGVALAGELVGLQMGLGFATLFDPGSGGQVPVTAALFTAAALLLFLSIDGHLVLIGTLAEGFRDLPPGALFGRLDAAAFARAGGMVFATGLQLALPVLAGVLLVNLALALVARVSPQLNIFSVGFPASLLAGLALLALTAPAWVAGIEAALRTAVLRLLP
jgi:flagellar biosynthetic protein FliR